METFKINIPQPCAENWDAMTKTAQGKFCAACQQTVVDFTDFSTDEISQWLSKHSNKRVCGRFDDTQLLETYQYYAPRKATNLLKYAATAASIFLLVQPSRAQETPTHLPIIDFKLLEKQTNQPFQTPVTVRLYDDMGNVKWEEVIAKNGTFSVNSSLIMPHAYFTVILKDEKGDMTQTVNLTNPIIGQQQLIALDKEKIAELPNIIRPRAHKTMGIIR
jgi:hypothetical protein